MSTCQYCHKSKLIKVNQDVYCSTCESYFTFKKGVQQHIYVPIEELDQISLHGNICCKCEKVYEKDLKITCQTFNEYYDGLYFCKKCKERNFKFIKNAYHKNFILYRTKEKTFSYLFIVFISMIWLLFFNSNIIFGLTIFILCRRQTPGLFYTLLQTTALLLFANYASSVVVYCFLFYRMLTFTRNIFKVPQNLENSPDIDEHIKSLSLAAADA